MSKVCCLWARQLSSNDWRVWKKWLPNMEIASAATTEWHNTTIHKDPPETVWGTCVHVPGAGFSAASCCAGIGGTFSFSSVLTSFMGKRDGWQINDITALDATRKEFYYDWHACKRGYIAVMYRHVLVILHLVPFLIRKMCGRYH